MNQRMFPAYLSVFMKVNRHLCTRWLYPCKESVNKDVRLCYNPRPQAHVFLLKVQDYFCTLLDLDSHARLADTACLF